VPLCASFEFSWLPFNFLLSVFLLSGFLAVVMIVGASPEAETCVVLKIGMHTNNIHDSISENCSQSRCTSFFGEVKDPIQDDSNGRSVRSSVEEDGDPPGDTIVQSRSGSRRAVSEDNCLANEPEDDRLIEGSDGPFEAILKRARSGSLPDFTAGESGTELRRSKRERKPKYFSTSGDCENEAYLIDYEETRSRRHRKGGAVEEDLKPEIDHEEVEKQGTHRMMLSLQSIDSTNDKGKPWRNLRPFSDLISDAQRRCRPSTVGAGHSTYVDFSKLDPGFSRRYITHYSKHIGKMDLSKSDAELRRTVSQHFSRLEIDPSEIIQEFLSIRPVQSYQALNSGGPPNEGWR